MPPPVTSFIEQTACTVTPPAKHGIAPAWSVALAHLVEAATGVLMRCYYVIVVFATALSCSNGADLTEERLRKELDEMQQARAALAKREREIQIQLRELQEGIDKTKGLSDICPVHNGKMQVQRVPIAYGMPLRLASDPTEETRKREFPFAQEHWNGGCILDKYTHAKTYVCPACQKAEKAWRAARSK